MRTILCCAVVAGLVPGLGCSSSHGTGDDRPDATPHDADPDRRSTPDPPPCGDEPAAPECQRLCDEACEAFDRCGGDFAACLEGCERAYACPGESPGHDAAICGDAGYEHTSCAATCEWVSDYGGHGRGSGPPCPDGTDAGPPDAGPVDAGPDTLDAGADAGPVSCAGRDYCDCTGACEPLIDLTPGCVCPCVEPFNCSGDTCACVCGGAEYLGCAPVDECEEPELRCDDPAGASLVGGCPACPG